MANVFIEESTMQAIGDAIREKTGKSEGILPSDMPAEIESIQQNELYPAKRESNWIRFWDDACLNAPVQVVAKETATSILVINSNNWLPLQDANGNNIYENNGLFVIDNGYRTISLGAFYPAQTYCFSVSLDTGTVTNSLIEFYNNDTLVGSGVLTLTVNTRTGIAIENVKDCFNKIRIYSADTAENSATTTTTLEYMCLYPQGEITMSLTAYYTPNAQRYDLPKMDLSLSSTPVRILSNDNTNIEVTYYHIGPGWDDFWDRYQSNGTRTNYDTAFSGYGWNKYNFVPKYSLDKGDITGAYLAFRTSTIPHIDYDLDFSNSTSCASLFNSSQNIRYIKSIKLNNSGNNTTLLTSSKIVTIGEIKGTIDYNATFASPNLDLGTCYRLINALADHSSDGISRTLDLHATTMTKLKGSEEGLSYLALATQKGWTVS